MGSANEDGVTAEGQAFLKVVREGRSFSGRERHCLFMNTGAGQFADVSAVTGFDLPDDGRALAQVDWDDDGDLDFWIANRNGPQIRFLENRTSSQTNDPHFLTVRLIGVTSNRDAVGARVRVFLADEPTRPITRTLRAGDAFLSQSSKRLHFGLGAKTTVDRIEVKWPSGSSQVVRSPKCDLTCIITENREEVVYQAPASRPVASTEATRMASESIDTGTSKAICFSMIAFPAKSFKNLSGFDTQFVTPQSKRVLVNLWAGWCKPCVEELAQFTVHADRLRAAGIDVVALSVGEIQGNETAVGEDALLANMNFPFRSGVTDDRLVTKLQLLNDTIFEVRNTLPLPTSFLLDHKRRVLAIYKGPVSVDELIADTSRTRVKTTDQWRAATVPFPGHWIMSPKRRHLFHFVEQLTDQGFLVEARDYVERNPKMFIDDARWPKLRQRLSKSPSPNP